MVKNIVLRKEQLKRVISEIGETLTSDSVRGYAFDWDDNILFMPTKINMQKNENGEWVDIKVSTEEFADVRNNPDYRLTPYAFDDFARPETFIRDVKIAIEGSKFAPSFEKFKEALTYANPFSIITARGTPPSAVKEGVKLLIGGTFNVSEIDKMLDSISKSYPSTTDMEMEEKIEFYLSKNYYSPVTSDEFKSSFGLDMDADRPELGKKIALKDYVEKVVAGVKKLSGDEYTKLSIGFSDDDRKNISTVISYIRDELSVEYPDIIFVVYDTSQGGENKIIVSKLDS